MKNEFRKCPQDSEPPMKTPLRTPLAENLFSEAFEESSSAPASDVANISQVSEPPMKTPLRIPLAENLFSEAFEESNSAPASDVVNSQGGNHRFDKEATLTKQDQAINVIRRQKPTVTRPISNATILPWWRIAWDKVLSFRYAITQRWRANGYRPSAERPFYCFLEDMILEFRRTLSFFLSLIVAGVIIGLAGVTLIVALIWPKLPSLDLITQYEPVLPMQVITQDGQVIGEFGNEHRTYTSYDQFPKNLVNALVAAEDQRFFSHSGFDPVGLARAFLVSMGSGQGKGTSTLTQQLARNFYLTQEKSLWRKVVEILLAVKIERELTKEKILEVYMNQIYLGQRSFGFTSAAKTYFDKEVGELTISECAIMAGLPKFPSVNPVTRPDRVLERRIYTLGRMLKDGYITQVEHDAALIEPLSKAPSKKNIITESNYVAEMARQYLVDLLRTQGVENPESLAYSKGFRVITSIRSDWQKQAEASLRQGVIQFELDHGFRGPELRVKLTAGLSEEAQRLEWEDHFDNLPIDDLLHPALVVGKTGSLLEFYVQGGERFTLDINKNMGLKKFTELPVQDKNNLGVGAVVRVFVKVNLKNIKTKEGVKKVEEREWNLTQLPKVQGGLVAVNPNNGRVEALVGGYSYTQSQFNRITQAWRQPGSTFKPFIYSAAIDHGVGAGEIFEDKLLEYPEPSGKKWAPKNYDNTYDGPITVRRALATSKNSIVIQLLDQMGVEYTHQYITRFGFDPKKIPAVLSMGLGSGEVTPMQMAAAYSQFANGGYRIQPWIISEVRDATGKIYYQYKVESAKKPENLVLDPRNVFIMDSLMKEVVKSGTASRAGAILQRPDLAGKTGTTNEYVDAWFCGYQPNLVSVVWVGYDQPAKLGRAATGGKIALPIWIDFMKTALASLPIELPERPADIGEYNADFVLKEFQKDSAPSLLPWESWGDPQDRDWESGEPANQGVDPRILHFPEEQHRNPPPLPQTSPNVRFF